MNQEHLSEYWYAKKPMPNFKRQIIKALVFGEDVGEVSFGESTRKLLKVAGSVFSKAFMMNREFLFCGDFTAPSDENDYENATNYLTEDGLAGFSITDTGWLVSLFSNCSERGFARAVVKYVLPKAYKLSCIVTDKYPNSGLIELYKESYGFRAYVKTINDTEVMREHYGDHFIDAFIDRHGRPFHVFMIGHNAVGEASEILSFTEYFKAQAFVETTVVQSNIRRS